MINGHIPPGPPGSFFLPLLFVCRNTFRLCYHRSSVYDDDGGNLDPLGRQRGGGKEGEEVSSPPRSLDNGLIEDMTTIAITHGDDQKEEERERSMLPGDEEM